MAHVDADLRAFPPPSDEKVNIRTVVFENSE